MTRRVWGPKGLHAVPQWPAGLAVTPTFVPHMVFKKFLATTTSKNPCWNSEGLCQLALISFCGTVGPPASHPASGQSVRQHGSSAACSVTSLPTYKTIYLFARQPSIHPASRPASSMPAKTPATSQPAGQQHDSPSACQPVSMSAIQPAVASSQKAGRQPAASSQQPQPASLAKIMRSMSPIQLRLWCGSGPRGRSTEIAPRE